MYLHVQSGVEEIKMIFYFSGTGNSLYTAQKISSALDESLMSMADALRDKDFVLKLSAGTGLGLVFPVYFYTVPKLVRAFIQNLRLVSEEKPYVYAVLTCGGQTGQAGRVLERLLLEQRLELAYLASVRLPDNYIPLLKVPNAKKQQTLFEKANQDLDRIILDIKQMKSGDYDDKKGFLPFLFTLFASPFYRDGRQTRKFRSTDACRHCGLCAKICPEGAIKIKEGRPVWVKDRCTFCLGCLHRCPEKAIQYGFTTQRKSRYVNPYVVWPQ